MKLNQNKTLLSLLLATTLLLTLSPILSIRAQSNTQATDSASTDDEQVKANIQERIRQVVDNPNNKQESNLKGWLGTIESISAETISITTDSETRLVAITPDTTIDQDEKSLDLEELIINSTILAVGTIDDTDILTAQQITVTQKPEAHHKLSILSSVSEVDTINDTISVINLNQSSPLLINITKDTLFSDSDTQKDPLDITNINPQDRLLVVYQPSSKDPSILNALLIHRTFTASPKPSPSPENESQ